jgi:hypothetical protein
VDEPGSDEHGSDELRRARKLDPLRRLSPGGFRTIALNAVGWTCLIATGLAAGGLSVVAGTPAVAALPAGVVAAWLIVLGLDYRRWRNGVVTVGRDGLDPATGAEIVSRLRDDGLDASYEEHVFDEPDGSLYLQRGITCRNADRAKVEAVMDRVLRR